MNTYVLISHSMWITHGQLIATRSASYRFNLQGNPFRLNDLIGCKIVRRN